MTEYSYEMKEIIQNLAGLKYWIGLGNNFDACPNCGGWGFLSLTIASAGPYSTPTAHGSSVTSEIVGTNIVWYDTRTTAYVCPICKGQRKPDRAPEKPRPVSKYISDLADEF